MWAIVAVLAGCGAPEGAPGVPLWVLSRGADGTYAPEARELPELSDPYRLSGELGTGWRGGAVRVDEYARGRPLAIDYEVGEALVPLDADGLVLWSFYAHLGDARADLAARGHSLDATFPVDIAFAPVSFLDFSAVENAAWVTGQDVFVIFPDALSGLPLAANAGVVRHELGHAWFQQLTTDAEGEVPWLDPEVAGSGLLTLRSLNEGFADAVATLTLDDPAFIDASIPMPTRDVTTDVTSAGRYPEGGGGALDALTYDPYALGTVYASFAWDVREATDPDTALDLAVAAVEAWAATGAWEDADGWVLAYVDLAEGDAKAAACASAALRFPHLELTGC